ATVTAAQLSASLLLYLLQKGFSLRITWLRLVQINAHKIIYRRLRCSVVVAECPPLHLDQWFQVCLSFCISALRLRDQVKTDQLLFCLKRRRVAFAESTPPIVCDPLHEHRGVGIFWWAGLCVEGEQFPNGKLNSGIDFSRFPELIADNVIPEKTFDFG